MVVGCCQGVYLVLQWTRAGSITFDTSDRVQNNSVRSSQSDSHFLSSVSSRRSNQLVFALVQEEFFSGICSGVVVMFLELYMYLWLPLCCVRPEVPATILSKHSLGKEHDDSVPCAG
ncbi:hypothetical protein B0H21DRAFT_83454 [Amylocystis lapponica]|nr:hypothetical protein B0H21DRAFT_83454 [Amylocystis lapponica]